MTYKKIDRYIIRYTDIQIDNIWIFRMTYRLIDVSIERKVDRQKIKENRYFRKTDSQIYNKWIFRMTYALVVL